MFLYGTRQVGKTYSVLEFGEKYYKNVAYFDTSNNYPLISTLIKEKILKRKEKENRNIRLYDYHEYMHSCVLLTEKGDVISQGFYEEDSLCYHGRCHDLHLCCTVHFLRRQRRRIRYRYHLLRTDELFRRKQQAHQTDINAR